MGTFLITKRQNGFYKFEFHSRKGKILFTSKDFELRFECEEFISFLKENCLDCEFFKYKTANGKYYFKIYINQSEFATSRKFTTNLLMQKGMDEFLKYGKQAEYLDFSFPNDVFQ